jgi:ribosomal protein S18 acetylase RimI-like enzyme
MDLLIRLYALPAEPPDLAVATATAAGLRLRKPLGCEHDAVVAWVQRTFGPGWASEARAALGNRPVTLQAALDPALGLLGFCCHDATALGMVGPIGVAAEARGRGIGRALLRACLADMRSAGYAYAVVGAVGVPAFFHQVAGATPIEGSEPGLYAGMLR